MDRSNRSPLWRLPADREVREELDFHLEMRIREYVDQGLDEAEARRRALVRFGDPERHAADCRRLASARNRRWGLVQWFEDARDDARFAWRQLGRRPVYALTLLGLLAGGLGTTAAAVHLVSEALWRPPAFPEPSRLVTLWDTQPERENFRNLVAPTNFMAWRDELGSLDAVSAFINVTANLDASSAGVAPRRVSTRWVTEGYFDILGRPPLAGQFFRPEDAVEGAAPSIVLGHALWQREFGGRRDVVGETVSIDGRPHVVLGVTPPGVEVSMGAALSPYGDAPDLYRPLPIDERWRSPQGRWMMVIGRLTSDATLETARAELDAATRRRHAEHPAFHQGWSAALVPLAEHLREPLRTPMLALAGAVALVLLIVCVDASNLLLGNLLSRLRELRVRSALGAGAFRIARQLLAESVLIAAVAAVGGWLIARGLLALARHHVPAELLVDREGLAGVEWLGPVVAVLTIGCVVAFTSLPMALLGRRLGRLGGGRDAGDSRGLGALRSALVFGQMVFALVLLVGAGLLTRTVLSLAEVDPGFRAGEALSFSVAPPRGLEDADLFTFYDRLTSELGALPGVATVGAVSHLPLASAGAATSYWDADREPPEPTDQPVADVRIVRDDYFAAMGIARLEGRAFDRRDHAEAPGAVIVSRGLAERLWPDGSAIGHRLVVRWGEDGVREVVGVVGDVHHASLDSEARDTIYFPQRQERESGLSLVLRLEPGFGDDDPVGALAEPIRDTVHALDPQVPIFDLRTLDTVIDASMANQRFLARVLVTFAAIALLLAVVGIYGVTTLRVRESRREIGVRLALGASPRQIVRQVVGRTGRLTLAAAAVGIGVAVFAGRALESMLYGVERIDPPTLAATAALLASAALVAALVPAQRAARLDPTTTLREE